MLNRRKILAAIWRLWTAISDCRSLRTACNSFEGLGNMHEDNALLLAGDLLWGAKDIALEIFGNNDTESVRRTYYMLERSQLPAEKVGDIWVGSRQRIRCRLRGGEAA